MKSILLHVADDPGFEGRLQAALDLARAFSGHLHGLQPRRIPAYFGADAAGFGAGAALVAELIDQEAKLAQALRERLEARLAHEDVPFTIAEAVGEPAEMLIQAASLQDLVVMSLAKAGHAPQAAVPEVVVRADTPVLAIPQGHMGFDPGRPALVAWKPTVESAKAVRAAVPLLARAASVTILVVDPGDETDLPPTEAARYLSRHGVRAEMAVRQSGSMKVADTLIAAARELEAGVLVMGAYSRSRTIQFLMGGVTRDFLEQAPLPLFMVH
ncbi:MAG: universal stress protein [Sphingomonadaceae bacterium]|uniref:universal stress protein n=1 Tax=Thermaurantiacus sp. TaxID=2820283 RepID=UPI00298F2107|nr:universal stress protein [Thermaurantiacus sp.]MCS6986040.1 universal stress protein [Sphingomonadaceae bacterium]MDW8414744.1 universal stress protein [Thermaurantiacus sp.]